MTFTAAIFLWTITAVHGQSHCLYKSGGTVQQPEYEVAKAGQTLDHGKIGCIKDINTVWRMHGQLMTGNSLLLADQYGDRAGKL